MLLKRRLTLSWPVSQLQQRYWNSVQSHTTGSTLNRSRSSWLHSATCLSNLWPIPVGLTQASSSSLFFSLPPPPSICPLTAKRLLLSSPHTERENPNRKYVTGWPRLSRSIIHQFVQLR